MRNDLWMGLVLIVAVALPAQAQERPSVRPQQDVAVSYRVQQVGQQGEAVARTIQMYWTGQGSRLRLEVEGQPGFVLVDFATDRTTLVMPGQHLYAEMPFDPAHAPGLDIPPGVALTKGGVESVAGVRCTDWTMHGPQGGGTACITGDGVLLRVRGEAASQPSALEALSVAYGPQPAALFTVPPGLKAVVPR